MTVREIVRKHLQENGYDGLVNGEVECGCGLDDLEPCGQVSGECKAAYRALCTDECEHDRIGAKDDYHFQTKKPEVKP